METPVKRTLVAVSLTENEVAVLVEVEAVTLAEDEAMDLDKMMDLVEIEARSGMEEGEAEYHVDQGEKSRII